MVFFCFLFFQITAATPSNTAATPPCTFKTFLILAPDVGAASAVAAAPEVAAAVMPEVMLVMDPVVIDVALVMLAFELMVLMLLMVLMVLMADIVDATDDALIIVEAPVEAALGVTDSTVFLDSTTN